MRLFAACLALTLSIMVPMLSPNRAAAQEPDTEKAFGPTVFTNAEVIDGTGTDPKKDMAIVVSDGTITAIDTTKNVPVPAGARVIDCKGKTILPGLISDHSHVGVIDGVTQAPENYNAANILRQRRQYTAYGVTTVTALGMNYPLFYTLKNEAHDRSQTVADLFGAGEGIGVPGGMPPVTNGYDPVIRPTSPEEARDAVRNMSGEGADLIKIWLDSGDGKFPKMAPEIYQAVIDEAHKSGLRVAAHVHDLADARSAVLAGVDILAHGVRDKEVNAEFIQLLKDKGVWYIPTLQLDEATFLYAEQPKWMKEAFFQHALQPALKARFDDREWREKTKHSSEAAASRKSLAMNKKNIKTLFETGVKIGFGTDSGAMAERIPGFAEHRELHLLVDSGLTPLEALTLATGRAAELLQLSDRGTLTVGKRADLVIVEGDPAKNIANVDRIVAVWRGGEASGNVESFAP